MNTLVRDRNKEQFDSLAVSDRFNREGYVILRNSVDVSVVASAAECLSRQFGAFCPNGDDSPRVIEHAAMLVGEKRYQVAPFFEAPFALPSICCAVKVVSVVERILGAGFNLSSLGAVISLAGAPPQHVHRDFEGIFGGVPIDGMLPSFAATLIIPLVEVTEENGPTMIWPGSHRLCGPHGTWSLSDAVRPLLKLGDCLLMDYRVVHAGGANNSGVSRPILYNVYSRPWFRDHLNFRAINRFNTPSVRLPLANEVQKMLSPDDLAGLSSAQLGGA